MSAIRNPLHRFQIPSHVLQLYKAPERLNLIVKHSISVMDTHQLRNIRLNKNDQPLLKKSWTQYFTQTKRSAFYENDSSFSRESFYGFCRAIRQIEAITQIALSNLEVEECHPSDAAARLMIALRNHPNIEVFSLMHSRLRDRHAEYIGKKLKTGKFQNLGYLDLSMNKIGNIGAISIVESLLKLPSTHRFSSLDLSHNLIEPPVVEEIKEVLRKEKPDFTVNLDPNTRWAS